MSSGEPTTKQPCDSCSIKSCDQPAAGVGLFFGLSLCKEHLEKDSQKARALQTDAVQKLQRVIAAEHREQMRTELQMLAAEVQEVNDTFDAVQEKLQQWRDRAVSRLQTKHDSVAGRLRDAAEAEECEKEVSLASDAGDMKKVLQTIVSIEQWLDAACERSIEFYQVQMNLRSRQGACGNVSGGNLRSVGDVAAGVQQLQFVIDKHITDVMQHCCLDDGQPSADSASLCSFVTSIDSSPFKPDYVAVCTNTAGFVGNSSGRVVRAESAAEDCVPLPQPCVLVSPDFDDDDSVDHLLVTSLDGSLRLQCHCNLDWKQNITGLHCDSKRQLLYVAQLAAVTVTDLSGVVTRIINAGSLQRPSVYFVGIDGNCDKIFLGDQSEKCVLAVSKDSGELQFVIDLRELHQTNQSIYLLALSGSKMLLTDDVENGAVYKVCSISGQLIASYPTQRSGVQTFQRPFDVAVDSRGLMFVSEHLHHTVRVVSSSGAIVQSLGIPGLRGSGTCELNGPTGVTLVDEADCRVLVVSEWGNKRLCVFQLN